MDSKRSGSCRDGRRRAREYRNWEYESERSFSSSPEPDSKRLRSIICVASSSSGTGTVSRSRSEGRSRNSSSSEIPRRYSRSGGTGNAERSNSARNGDPHSEPPFRYRVLCISHLPSRASDEQIYDSIEHQIRRMGSSIRIKVVRDPTDDERVAFIYFRSCEDAGMFMSKYSKDDFCLYGKRVHIEPAIETPSSSTDSGKGNPCKEAKSGDRDGGSGSWNDFSKKRSKERDPGPVSYGSHGGEADSARPGTRHSLYPYPPRPRPPPLLWNPPPNFPARGSGLLPLPMAMQVPSSGFDLSRLAFPTLRDPFGKFPHHLQHIPPENDPLATRTLFVGNLEPTITEEKIRRVFGAFGNIVDVCIKKPQSRVGNSFAFVAYENLDMAYRAKYELSGNCIGRLNCKIGYGKIEPGKCIWVGGLGPRVTYDQLKKEFDYFGLITRIDWKVGEDFAYISYQDIQSAEHAVNEMRGYELLNGPGGKRIRTDFAPPYKNVITDAEEIENGKVIGSGSSLVEPESRAGTSSSGIHADWSPVSGADSENSAQEIRSICKIVRGKTPEWTGTLLFKSSEYPTRMYMVEGNFSSIEPLMKNIESGLNELRIGHRFSLKNSDQGPLATLMGRINEGSENDIGIFIALQTSKRCSSGSKLSELISYLTGKNVVGIVQWKESKNKIHVFPKCEMSTEILKRKYPNIENAGIMDNDDYLVVVVGRQSG